MQSYSMQGLEHGGNGTLTNTGLHTANCLGLNSACYGVYDTDGMYEAVLISNVLGELLLGTEIRLSWVELGEGFRFRV